MRNKMAFLFIAAFSFYTLAAFSQPREVTVDECINISLENHPDLMASLENQNTAAANYRVAKAGKSVIIDASAKTVEYLNAGRSSAQVNIPGRDTTIGLFAGLGATYNVYDPKRTAKIDSSRMNIDYSKMSTLNTQATIVCNVKKAYYDFALARESSILREELMKKFEEKLAKTRILYRVGQRSALDVSKAEVDFESSKIEYERSKNYENTSRTTLLTSMGIVEETIEFNPVKVTDLPELKYTVNELYNFSLNNYTEIKMVKLKKDIGKLNIAVQQAAHYPSVDIQAAFGYENQQLQGVGNFSENLNGSNWSPTFHAGFVASMPIYSGGAVSSNVDNAVAQYNSVLYEERKLNVKVKNLIRTRYNEMQEFKKQADMSILMTGNANKHLILTQKYYETGTATQLEIRDAELSVLNAQLSLIKARYGYFIALADLSNIVGLGENYLCSKK